MADLTSMNISLPNTLRTYVQHRVDTGGFGNVSEYIRDLIRRDRDARVQDALEAAIREGLESGESVELNEKEWASIRNEIRERLSSNRRASA